MYRIEGARKLERKRVKQSQSKPRDSTELW